MLGWIMKILALLTLLLSCEAETDPCKPSQTNINTQRNRIHNTNLLSIKSAMNGYDPRFSLPGSKRAIANRQQIFVATETLRNNQTAVNNFVARFTEEVKCDQLFISQIIRSYDEYVLQNIPFSFYYDEDEMNESSSMKKAQDQVRMCDEHQRKLMCFFDKGGKIVQIKMQCETSEIDLSTNVPPVFTAAFKEGLRSLDIAATEPHKESSKRAFIEFVQDFGTHYKKVTQFGSLLIFEKLILSDEVSDSDVEEEYVNCVVNAAYASVENKTLKSLYPKIFEDLVKQCDYNKVTNRLFLELNLNRVKVSANGPTLMYMKNLDENSTLPANPIYFQLMSITDLFSKWWFKNIPSSPLFDHMPVWRLSNNITPLNGTAIDNLFRAHMPSYEASLAARKCSALGTWQANSGKSSVTPASSACPPELEAGPSRNTATVTCNHGELASEPCCDE